MRKVQVTLNTVQNLGDHGRETTIALDVDMDTTLSDLLKETDRLGTVIYDNLTVKFIELAKDKK